ncbi:MAG: hypothetical protein ABI196_25790, partial [Bradyrhizobium sp.]
DCDQEGDAAARPRWRWPSRAASPLLTAPLSTHAWLDRGESGTPGGARAPSPKRRSHSSAL